MGASMIYARRAAIAIWIGAFYLSSTSPKADQLPDPYFDVDAFHRHVRAGTLLHTIIQSPVCTKGGGVSGEFIMTTPEQNEFPLSITTVVGPFGAKSFVTSKLDTSSAVLSEVAGILNSEAREVVEKIIADCKASKA
jgi:hypothetical protein